MFIMILIALVCISFLWSLVSLQSELKKNTKAQQVTEALSKGRVVFHAPSMSEMQRDSFGQENSSPQSQTTIENREDIKL